MDTERGERAAWIARMEPLVAIATIRQPIDEFAGAPGFGGAIGDGVRYPVRRQDPASVDDTTQANHLTDTREVAWRYAEAAAGPGRACCINCDVAVLPQAKRLPQARGDKVGKALASSAFDDQPQHVRIRRAMMKWTTVFNGPFLQGGEEGDQGVRRIARHRRFKQPGSAVSSKIVPWILISLFEVQAHPHVDNIAQAGIRKCGEIHSGT